VSGWAHSRYFCCDYLSCIAAATSLGFAATFPELVSVKINTVLAQLITQFIERHPELTHFNIY
jgi:hypothetical protein